MADTRTPPAIGARVAGVRAEDWDDASKKRPAYAEPRETVVGTVVGIFFSAPDVVTVVSDVSPGDLVTVRDPEILVP